MHSDGLATTYIEKSRALAPPYAEAGAYNVTFHAEATTIPGASGARDIRGGARRQPRREVSLKPCTPLTRTLESLNTSTRVPGDVVEARLSRTKFFPSVLRQGARGAKLVDS